MIRGMPLGGALGGCPGLHRCRRHRRRAPVGLFDDGLNGERM